VAVQRKVVCSELLNELDETMFETLPRLRNFSDNPVLLIEENFGIDQTGHLFNRGDSRETDMLATSYFGYLETIRKSGVEVVTTRDLNQSVWWMIATHGYLAKEHYPKSRKAHSIKEQAVGMMTAVSGIGEARALKALKDRSLKDMITKNEFGGLTMKQVQKLNEVMGYVR
jgi:ERCC4-type nuclease